MNRSDRFPSPSSRDERPGDDRRLLRFLHGELAPEEAEELRRRLDREPELAARLRRLEATWTALELPPPAPAPPGFASRVAARALDRAGDQAAFRPAWVRAAAAAALAGGLAAGAVLGWVTLPGRPEAARAAAEAGTATATLDELSLDSTAESMPSLAESYWSAFDPEGEGLAAGAASEEEAR